MKIAFDTCVAVDIFGKTTNFASAYTALDVALLNKIEVFLPVTSTTDIVYLLHSRGFAQRAEARQAVEKLENLFIVLDVTASDYRLAAQSEMKDYEDALIAYAAKRQGIDLIITRNKKDFVFSPIPALTPEEFIDIYVPEGFNYEEFHA